MSRSCESLIAFGASRTVGVGIRIGHGVCALLALTAALASLPARATGYETNATVAKIYSVDRVRVGAYDHFTVNGFTSAGSCITNDGLVAIYLRDDEGGKRQLSMVLLARAMGWSLNVRVDDTVKLANGGCLLYVLEVLR